MKYGTKACCGYGGGAYNFNPKVYCGNSKMINGHKVTATACIDPQNYVSWDGVHATEAANKLTAYAILNGSYSDPPFPLRKFCEVQPIGWSSASYMYSIAKKNKINPDSENRIIIKLHDLILYDQTSWFNTIRLIQLEL